MSVSPGPRRAAALLVVIVLLAVASAVIVSVVKLAAAQRRQLQAEQWSLQAAWLAESGLDRAAARLAANADYQGETWAVPAEELDHSAAAAVSIHVEPVANKPERRLVRVQADYPDDPQQRARQVREAIVLLRSSNTERVKP
jgi:type II secretory pathway component PulK